MPLRTWAVVGLIAATAVGASVHALVGRGSETPPGGDGSVVAARKLAGANLPPPRALAGILYVSTADRCRVEAIDLGALALAGSGPVSACDLWVSPDGGRAVIGDASTTGEPFRDLSLVGLRERPQRLRRLGVAQGSVSWSLDGRRVAWCAADGDSVIAELATGRTDRVLGCSPRFTPKGVLLTSSRVPQARRLLRDGQLLLGERDLAEGFPSDLSGPVRVLGYDERGDGLLAVLAAGFARSFRDILEERGLDPSDADALGLDRGASRLAVAAGGGVPRTELQLWRGDRLAAVVPLPELADPTAEARLRSLVRFSPDGAEVAVVYPSVRSALALVNVRFRRAVLEPQAQTGFAWSPDGTWFALSAGGGIQLYGLGRSDPAYVLPVPAGSLAWR